VIAVSILLLVVAAILVFEYASLRWGFDSRDDFHHFQR
jgi:hypothetical protein